MTWLPMSGMAGGGRTCRLCSGSLRSRNPRADASSPLIRGVATSSTAATQGLTLVHVFAQLEPFLSLKPAKHPTHGK